MGPVEGEASDDENSLSKKDVVGGLWEGKRRWGGFIRALADTRSTWRCDMYDVWKKSHVSLLPLSHN